MNEIVNNFSLAGGKFMRGDNQDLRIVLVNYLQKTNKLWK